MQALLAISILCVLALVWVAVSIARHLNASHRRGHASDELLSIVPKVQQSVPYETDFSRVLAKAIEDPQLPAPIFTQVEPTNHVETNEANALPEPASAPLDTPPVSEPTTFVEPLGNISAAPLAANRFSRAALMAGEPYPIVEEGATIRVSQLRQRAAELQQNVHDISSIKGWNMPPKPLRPRTNAVASTSAATETSENIPSQAVAESAKMDTRTTALPAVTSEVRFVLNAGTEGARKPIQTLRRGLTQRLDRAYARNGDAGDLTDPYQIPRAGLHSGLMSTKQARS